MKLKIGMIVYNRTTKYRLDSIAGPYAIVSILSKKKKKSRSMMPLRDFHYLAVFTASMGPMAKAIANGGKFNSRTGTVR